MYNNSLKSSVINKIESDTFIKKYLDDQIDSLYFHLGTNLANRSSVGLKSLINLFELERFISIPEGEKDTFINERSEIFKKYLQSRLEKGCELLSSEKFMRVVSGQLTQVMQRREQFTDAGDSLMSTGGFMDLSAKVNSGQLKNIINGEQAKVGGKILGRILSVLVSIHKDTNYKLKTNLSSDYAFQIRGLSRIVISGYADLILDLSKFNSSDGDGAPTPHRLLLKGLLFIGEIVKQYPTDRYMLQGYQALRCYLDKSIHPANFFESREIRKGESLITHKGSLGLFQLSGKDILVTVPGGGVLSTWRGGKVVGGRGSLAYSDIASATTGVESSLLETHYLHKNFLGKLDAPLRNAHIFNCEASTPMVGCVAANIHSSYSKRQGKTHWFIPHSPTPSDATVFNYSLINSVQKGQFGQSVFIDETGKGSTFILQGINHISANGAKTLEKSVVFLQDSSHDFKLYLYEGAGSGMVIVSPKGFVNDKIQKDNSSSYPTVLHPDIYAVNYVESLKTLVTNMYSRFPYIRAAYVPVFSRVREDIESLKDLKKVQLGGSTTTPKIINDPLSVELIFSNITSADRAIVLSIFENIVYQEDTLDTSEGEKINSLNRTIQQERLIEQDIKRQRLEALEKVILKSDYTHSDVLNTELNNFFNPFNHSFIQKDPTYGMMSLRGRQSLDTYIQELNKSFNPNSSKESTDWEIFIATFNFLRSMNLNLPATLHPSKLLFS